MRVNLTISPTVDRFAERLRTEPKCARCGHHCAAHDEGDCAVNKHEDATGPECECEGYVSPETCCDEPDIEESGTSSVAAIMNGAG